MAGSWSRLTPTLLAVVLAMGGMAGAVPVTRVTAAEPVARTAVWLDGEQGDYIHGTRSTVYETPAFVILEGTGSPADPSAVRFSIQSPAGAPRFIWYYVTLAAPKGEQLGVGEYTGATRAPFRTGSEPGIDVYGDGRGCNTTTGDFTVHEFERNDDGTLRRFAASFRQWCSSDRAGAKLIGEVRFASTMPMPASSADVHELTMAPQPVTTWSEQRAVTLTNLGTTTLSGSAAVDGRDGADFAVTSAGDCLTVGFAPGDTCVVRVRYAPAAQGARAASLAVTLGGILGPRRWRLAGSGQLPTTTTVTTGAGSHFPGARLLTASVTPTAATGAVRFRVDGQPVGRAGLDAGRAGLWVPIAPGALAVTAEYIGTDIWAPSSSADLAHDGDRASAVRIEPSRHYVTIGEPVDVLAAVTLGGAWLASGTVRLVDTTTGTELATGDINPERPELLATLAFFSPGEHRLEARYSGDALTAPATASVVIRVHRVPTQVSLSAPATVHFPAAAALVARVSPVPDGGTVTFRTATETVGSAAVDTLTGIARLDFAADPGLYDVTASYAGTPSFNGSESATRTVRSSFATRVVVTAMPAFACEGDRVDLVATVSALPSGAPSAGRLVLRDGVGGVFLASTDVTSSDRDINFATDTLSAGTHTIEATYAGAGDYDGSRGTTSVTVAAGGDCVAPAGTVLLNGGSSFTRSDAITLSLSATDPAPGTGVAQMRLSSTGVDGSWSGWVPFAASHPWTLPGADGSKWVYVQFRDGAGNVSRAASAGIVLDRAPAQETVPSHAFTLNGTLGTTVPVTVSYPARDALSGIAAYRLDESTDAGATYRSVALPTATTSSAARSLPARSNYRFRANATDRAGNVGALLAGPVFAILQVDQGPTAALVYSGTWIRRDDPALFGGTERYAEGAGSRMTYSFTGSRIALVGQRGPQRGLAEVWVDRIKVGTIDLYSPTVQLRKIVFARTLAAASHTVELRVLGMKSASSQGTRVGIDAILVAR